MGCAFALCCRYNISCYSSLLQQVDATADADLVFQQRAASAAAAQSSLAPYGALWLHPDDLQHLQQPQGQQGSSVGGQGFGLAADAGRPTASGVPGARASTMAAGSRWAAPQLRKAKALCKHLICLRLLLHPGTVESMCVHRNAVLLLILEVHSQRPGESSFAAGHAGAIWCEWGAPFVAA